MKCPHCQVDFFEQWHETAIQKRNSAIYKGGKYNGEQFYLYAQTTQCPRCSGLTLNIIANDWSEYSREIVNIRVIPRGGNFSAAPPEVPASIAADYAEANEVLPISSKASAALSRRCLQAILTSHGYMGRDLMKQVEAIIAETDSSKALPTALKENIDAIRNFGNFSAHPITDQTTLQIVDVETGEAEWCLELLLDLFDHYYVAPARALEKRAALSAKLASAGKPPMKG